MARGRACRGLSLGHWLRHGGRAQQLGGGHCPSAAPGRGSVWTASLPRKGTSSQGQWLELNTVQSFVGRESLSLAGTASPGFVAGVPRRDTRMRGSVTPDTWARTGDSTLLGLVALSVAEGTPLGGRRPPSFRLQSSCGSQPPLCNLSPCCHLPSTCDLCCFLPLPAPPPRGAPSAG